MKWFNCTKGYGFIRPEDGSADVFVHQSVLQMDGFRSVWEARASGGATVERED